VIDMPKVGVIGTGRLGGMIVRGLARAGAVPAESMIIQNRTGEKALKLAREIPGIKVASTPGEVLREAGITFLCVKPQDLAGLLRQTGTRVPGDKLLVSTLLVPYLSRMEQIISGPLARVYPAVVQETGRGVALAAFGRDVPEGRREELKSLMSAFGMTLEIPENLFRLCGDITSCGPAFMAYMIGSLARVAARRGLDPALARQAALETMAATASLLAQKDLGFDSLVDLVATPGGCTAEGIKVLAGGLDEMVDRVFSATEHREAEIDKQLTGL